jgi:hypothetical protein
MRLGFIAVFLFLFSFQAYAVLYQCDVKSMESSGPVQNFLDNLTGIVVDIGNNRYSRCINYDCGYTYPFNGLLLSGTIGHVLVAPNMTFSISLEGSEGSEEKEFSEMTNSKPDGWVLRKGTCKIVE